MLNKIREIINIILKKPSTPNEKEIKKVQFTFKHYTPDKQTHIENVRLTGYFPPPPKGYKSKAEEQMEGGANDCLGNPLRTLQNYVPGSYVSIAVDKKIIPLKSVLYFDGFVDEGGKPIVFYACDVGGATKGAHIDVCVANESESFKVKRKVKFVTIVGKA